jgi:hypothetical protein
METKWTTRCMVQMEGYSPFRWTCMDNLCLCLIMRERERDAMGGEAKIYVNNRPAMKEN